MSTNDLLNMRPGEGRPTIFTHPNARILDRMLVYDRGDALLGIAEPGRGGALSGYLQRTIFSQDRVGQIEITARTRQFGLHGPLADSVMEALVPGASALLPL